MGDKGPWVDYVLVPSDWSHDQKKFPPNFGLWLFSSQNFDVNGITTWSYWLLYKIKICTTKNQGWTTSRCYQFGHMTSKFFPPNFWMQNFRGKIMPERNSVIIHTYNDVATLNIVGTRPCKYYRRHIIISVTMPITLSSSCTPSFRVAMATNDCH